LNGKPEFAFDVTGVITSHIIFVLGSKCTASFPDKKIFF